MTSAEEYELLLSDEVRRSVAANLGRDPLEVALDSRVPHARTVATQVKYLQRAAAKLPSYRAAGCILPPRAYEQASSEACAAHRDLCGGSVLDLTCGLGVDACCLARRFERVVTLERDEGLAAVAKENFRRLGIRNAEVVADDAESYLASCRERFDWVYADPDRRDTGNRRLVRIELCAPDVRGLDAQLRRVADRLCLKLSPLFDVDEAVRLYPTARVEAVSLGGECKEIVVYDDGSGPSLTAAAVDRGRYTLPYAEARRELPPPDAFRPDEVRWLVVPDVTLQVTRLVRRHLAGKAYAASDRGFGFAVERPEGVLGRIFAVEGIEPFDPKALRREREPRRGYLRRDFPLSSERIAALTGIRPEGPVHLAFTQADGRLWTVRLGKEI